MGRAAKILKEVKMKRLAFLFVVIFTGMSLGLAQEPTATLVGRVTDPTHASISGAAIKVRNVNTNVLRTGQTEVNGEYTVSNLLPGIYDVTIEKPGFRPLRETSLELTADQTARVDVQLPVGTVSETVTVTAQVPLLNTETSSRGDVIARKEIEQIPLNGRDFNDLAFNVAGVQPSETGFKGAPYVVNGARADASNVVIDGLNDENPRDAGAQARPPLDSLQEFKLQTSGFSAEYGRLAGGVVNMVTKTGGNQLHGSLFELVRNDLFDGRNFFDPAGAKSKLRRNQFGGTLTGPLVIPKLYDGHDKTFFLVSWESYRQVQGSNVQGVVPTALERLGDFSQSHDALGNPIFLKDPLKSGSCTATKKTACFTGNAIPTKRINSIAQQLLNLYPLPNLSRAGGNNYTTNANTPDDWDSFLFRVDQTLTAKDTLSVRVLERWETSTNPFSGSGLGTFPSTTDVGQSLYGISETRIFTPHLINEFRAGLTRTTDEEISADAGTNFAAQLGISGTTTNPNLEAFPKFSINGFETLGDSANNPIRFTVNSFDVNDVVTWNIGKHTLKLGGDMLHVQYYQSTNSNFNGTFSFSGKFSNDPFADFLLGFTNSMSRKIGTVTNHIFSTNYALFVQDDYKVHPNLTLNLGVRYEIQSMPYEKDGQFTNFVPSLGQVIIASSNTVPNLNSIVAAAGLTGLVGVASNVGLPPALVSTNYNNLAPRVGFAWRPFGNNRTVLRSGYGIFYTGSRLSAIRTDFSGGFPFAITQTFTGSTSNPTALTLSNPFPAALAKDQGVTNSSGYDIDAPSPYLQSWNLTVERDLGKGVALEVGYAGSKGTHLGRKYDLNQVLRIENPNLALTDGTCPSCPRPFAGFNDIEFYSFGANSSYNAGTVTLRRAFQNGLFFRANYTYGKSIDENSGLNYAGDGGYFGAQNSLNLGGERGRSDFDIRHVFSADFVYQLPFKKNVLARGWQLAGSGAAYSGQPFTPQLSKASQDLAEATRPDRIASGRLPNPSNLGWFDLTAFQAVPDTAFRFGNSGRNILDGPGALLTNLSLSKEFRLGERGLLQLRWEVFNVLNHTNLALPNNHLDQPGAGTISSAKDPRLMQFGGRIQF